MRLLKRKHEGIRNETIYRATNFHNLEDICFVWKKLLEIEALTLNSYLKSSL